MIHRDWHIDAEAARRALRGELLGDELSTHARELAVVWLHRRGQSDAEIGAALSLSTYTAARIRERLLLRAHTMRPHLAVEAHRGA